MALLHRQRQRTWGEERGGCGDFFLISNEALTELGMGVEPNGKKIGNLNIEIGSE